MIAVAVVFAAVFAAATRGCQWCCWWSNEDAWINEYNKLDLMIVERWSINIFDVLNYKFSSVRYIILLSCDDGNDNNNKNNTSSDADSSLMEMMLLM